MLRRGKARAPFADDSDEDSIATDSTAESEQFEEYGVDRILLEGVIDEDGTPGYLIKWEGYPLGRGSWEPKDNIIDNDIVAKWEEEKRRIQQGLATPFDVTEWSAALEKMQDAKDERRRRRKAKRRKRGIEVSSDSNEHSNGEEDDDDDENIFVSTGDERRTKPKKRTQQPEVKRKGVAQRLSPNRRASRVVSFSSSDDELSPARSSGGDSLFDELASTAKPTQKRPATRRLTRTRATVEQSTSGTDSEDKPAPRKRGKAREQDPPARPTSARAAPVQGPTKPLSSKVPPQPAPQVAAKSALPTLSKATSSAPKAKRTRQPDPVFANWDAPKKGRQRPRVSGATPKDSTAPKFRTLSEQHRIQRYSKNELAPDPRALIMIDPKTGKVKPPANTVEGNNTGAINSAYKRRTPPPEQSPDPPAPDPVLATASAHLPEPAPPAHVSSLQLEKRETCWYWKQGICKFTNETCRRAHRDTGIHAVDKHLTCYYWITKGYCSRGDENCRFAHHDTGQYAPKPPDTLPPIDGGRPPMGFSERVPGQSSVPEQGAPQLSVERNLAVTPKKAVTCYYWRTRDGRCTKPDDVCEFAHHDTGNYAGPPGTFSRGQTFTTTATSANAVPVANRDNVAPHSARIPDVTLSERIDAGLKLQTAVQATRHGSGSPMNFTASPMHMGGPSPREPAQQTPQWNIVGAALQRRPSAPNFSMKATLVLSFYEDMSVDDIEVKLDICDLLDFKRLSGSDPVLRSERMVTTSDFEKLLWNEGLREAVCSTGGIFVDTEHASSIQNIADVCKTNVSGLLATPNGYDSKMLIYPGNAEEWRFLDREREHSSECILRFRLFDKLPIAPSQEPISQTEDVDKRRPAQILGEELVKLDSDAIFPKKELHKHPVRAVFIMLPPDHRTELEVLNDYFAALKCKVYHAGTPGAWDYFRKKYSSSCALIVHPDVPLWRIPGLYAFLSSTGGGVFSIGVNPIVAVLEEREAEFACERLFPRGMVLFITDDAFINEPEQTTEVINHFLESHRNKPEGGETTRIAARPGIVEWLLEVAITNNERGRRDNRFMALYNAMCKLSRVDLTDQDIEDDPENASNPLFLISLSPELLPALEAMTESHDQEAATDLAVDWFAGWALLYASRFRRFLVCHEPKLGVEAVLNGATLEDDPRGWGKKYQHIGVAPARTVLQLWSKKK